MADSIFKFSNIQNRYKFKNRVSAAKVSGEIEQERLKIEQFGRGDRIDREAVAGRGAGPRLASEGVDAVGVGLMRHFGTQQPGPVVDVRALRPQRKGGARVDLSRGDGGSARGQRGAEVITAGERELCRCICGQEMS